jgi:hypothetical protein
MLMPSIIGTAGPLAPAVRVRVAPGRDRKALDVKDQTEASEMSTQRLRMIRAVESLRSYMSSYDSQAHYAEYSAATFVDDVLYGLGVALDPDEHRYAPGFALFKSKLLRHLESSPFAETVAETMRKRSS